MYAYSVRVCLCVCVYACVTDGVVRKRNDTLQWSREGQKHCLIDNWIIMYSVIMLLCVYVHFILKCLLTYCMLFLLYCHKTMFTSISVCAHVACVQLTGRFILSFWPLCVGLYLHRSNFDIYLHSYSLCHLLLYCTYHSLHDCIWQQWSGMPNCVSKLCYTYIPVLFLLFTNILLLHTERVCIIGTVLHWKNINSISNDCHLHYLFTCLTHYEMNTHTYMHTNI